MKIPEQLDTPELREYLTRLCDRAERTLRNLHPKATRKGKLPDHVEEEIEGLKAETADDLLFKFASITSLRRVGGFHGPSGDHDVGLEIVTRQPVPIQLTSGRTVHIRSKSLRAYLRMASHWHAIALIDEALQPLVENGRLTDLPLIRRAREARMRELEMCLAIALSDAPNPREGIEPPEWIEEITHADMEAIQRAHVTVGVGRYQALPDPHGGDDGGEPERQGFGALIAMLAKVRRTTTEALITDDIWRILGELKMTADTPEPVEDLSDLGL